MSKDIAVCDYCLEQVSAVGDDAIYVCEEHGIVEASWHYEKEAK